MPQKNKLFQVYKSCYGLQNMKKEEITLDNKLFRGYIYLKSL